MQFGIYLIDQGLITATQFVDALRQQQVQRVPLGQLAIECGKLSVRQVYEVLRMQATSEHDRFGEAAIELGMLTPTDVAELLMEQTDRRPSLGKILVAMGAIDREQYEEALAGFRRLAERRGPATTLRRNLPHATSREEVLELAAEGA